MCQIAQYPGLYAKAEEQLRLENVPRECPGYELIKRGIVIAKIEGQMSSREFLKMIKEGIVIPSNRELKKNRDNALQWMIEALEVAEVIPLEPDEDIERLTYLFIREMADKL